MNHQQCCGHPLGKKTKTVPEESASGHHSLSPDPPAYAKDLQDTDSEVVLRRLKLMFLLSWEIK